MIAAPPSRWRAMTRPALVLLLCGAAGLPARAEDPAAAPADAAMSATAAPGGPPTPDAGWPCVQRRVGRISAGAVWSGPDPADAGAWDKDFEAAALAQKLASRRTAIEDVDGLLDAFVQTAGGEKSVRLTRVFAGVLDLVNAERDRVLLGIGRYAHGQSRLADRVRSESDKMSDAAEAPDSTESKELKDLESALKWDKRIFEERSRALIYVCETPVILERRIFDIARRIQQRI